MADVDTIQAAGCTSHIRDVTDVTILLQLIAQSLNVDMLTVDQINTAACASGIKNVNSHTVLLQFIAQLANDGAFGTGGGATAFNNQSGAGSPVGVVTPDYVGQFYVDTTPPYGNWYSIGLTNADWEQSL